MEGIDGIMLNKYVWDLYLQSGGNKTVTFFEKNLNASLSESYPDEIYHLQNYYCITQAILDDTKDQLQDLYAFLKESSTEVEKRFLKDEVSEEDAFEEIDELFRMDYDECLEEQGSDKGVFELLTNNLEFLSTDYALSYPGLFVPYYFSSNYNVLTKIAETFDIKLPEIPRKSDYQARAWHYPNICKALYSFRLENHLSYYELCAFLYDFAPHYIGGIDSYIIQDLPAPKSAYFIGGGGKNSDAVAENNPNIIAFWQCNPDTRVGDMIVMYLRTPISSISSVWRSLSVGFIDPFFYYYRCTFIGKPQKVTRIPLQEIKRDAVLGKMPIVTQNMQGINGVELKPSEYNYIVEKSGKDLPKLEYAVPESNGSFVNEKEVEEKLIKPLLSRLGYKQEDYVQQMHVEIGNHNYALIPDFVLHPVNWGGHYSGFAIIEAKRSIKNEKQLNQVKTQARSYAKLLGTRYSVIASMEKIWVTSKKDDYTDNIMEVTWDALADADTFYNLEKLIGCVSRE